MVTVSVRPALIALACVMYSIALRGEVTFDFQGARYTTTHPSEHTFQLWRWAGGKSQLLYSFPKTSRGPKGFARFGATNRFIFITRSLDESGQPPGESVNLHEPETLWISDGTPVGTKPVKAFPGEIFCGTVTSTSGVLLFSTPNANFGYGGRLHLWRSDATAAGTSMVTEFSGTNPAYEFGNDVTPADEIYWNHWRSAQLFQGKVYFPACTEGIGCELYQTDGSSPGTHLVKDLRPGATNSFPICFAEHEGKLAFSADDDSNGRPVVWLTDGTAAGTERAPSIEPSDNSTQCPAYR